MHSVVHGEEDNARTQLEISSKLTTDLIILFQDSVMFTTVVDSQLVDKCFAHAGDKPRRIFVDRVA
jgi:hypothetical protein